MSPNVTAADYSIPSFVLTSSIERPPPTCGHDARGSIIARLPCRTREPKPACGFSERTYHHFSALLSETIDTHTTALPNMRFSSASASMNAGSAHMCSGAGVVSAAGSAASPAPVALHRISSSKEDSTVLTMYLGTSVTHQSRPAPALLPRNETLITMYPDLQLKYPLLLRLLLLLFCFRFL